MQHINQGQRVPVASFTPAKTLTLDITIASGFTIDTACFGLDAGGKLSDDRYNDYKPVANFTRPLHVGRKMV